MLTTYTRHRNRVFWWVLLIALSVGVGTGVISQTWPLITDTAVGSRAESTVAPDEPGLPGRAVPILDSPHIAVGEAASAHYDSVPPTSGPHFAVPPAPGVYSIPLPDGLQVHALEHGHVGIQYAPDTPAGTVEALSRLGAQYPEDVFVAPYPLLGHGIALTAWGRIDAFDTLDETRVTRFVEALRGRYDHGWIAHGGGE
jgi:hypothetical protein